MNPRSTRGILEQLENADDRPVSGSKEAARSKARVEAVHKLDNDPTRLISGALRNKQHDETPVGTNPEQARRRDRVSNVAALDGDLARLDAARDWNNAFSNTPVKGLIRNAGHYNKPQPTASHPGTPASFSDASSDMSDMSPLSPRRR